MKTRFILLFSLFISSFVFSQNDKKTEVAVPLAVSEAFKQKYPDASIPTCKKDSAYTVTFLLEEMTGRAVFAADGKWYYTKYSVPEKELPSPIINYILQNYKIYKIKTSEIVEEPSVDDYYYVFAKSEGIGQPTVKLYFTLTGKLIKADPPEVIQVIPIPEVEVKTTPAIDSTKKIESPEKKIDPKELSPLITSYIKREYRGYSIKEAYVVSAPKKKSIYHVKVKKGGQKSLTLTELVFDAKGKFIEEKKEE